MMDEADRTDGAEAMPEAAGTDTSSPHAELRNTATPFAKKTDIGCRRGSKGHSREPRPRTAAKRSR